MGGRRIICGVGARGLAGFELRPGDIFFDPAPEAIVTQTNRTVKTAVKAFDPPSSTYTGRGARVPYCYGCLAGAS